MPLYWPANARSFDLQQSGRHTVSSALNMQWRLDETSANVEEYNLKHSYQR